MESTSALPTEEDLSKLLTAEQYSDLFCSVDVLPEDPGSHVRVADKLSSNEERDRLLARRNQRPGVRGIISIAKQGHKRYKRSSMGESADSRASHGGQLTFRPSGNPLIATSSHEFPLSDPRVRSLRIYPLHSQSTTAAVRIVSVRCASSSKPTYKKFLLQSDLGEHLTGFTARRCCGKLHAVSSAGAGFGSLAAFEGLALTVTGKKDGCLEVSAGQKVDVDLAAVHNQLRQQILQAEFRNTYMVDEKVFMYHTLEWPPPATPADISDDFTDMFDFLDDLGDIEGSSCNAPRHFPALSVGESDPINAGSSNQLGPVLNVQGDVTVSGIIRADQFLPLSDQGAKCNIRPTDHDALSILQKLKVYQYQFKSSPEGRRVLGLLAQELEKLVPEFVETDHDGFKRVDFTSLLSLSLQGIQQLYAQQQDINSRVSFVLLKVVSLTRRLESSLPASITRPSRVENISQQAAQQLAMTAEHAATEPTSVELATAEPATAQPATSEPAKAPACSSATGSQAFPGFKDNDAMVRHMLDALGETNDGLHQMVLNRIADFGHQSVWDSFQDALSQPSKGKSLFIKSLKKKQQNLKMRSAARTSDPMSPLRPAQIRLIQCLKSKQNKIIVARTGFGKTRVAQEHIQMLLHEDKTARTVFLTDKTLLAMQQTSSFPSSIRVECFTSYSQMTVEKWPVALDANDVLVMTPQSLVNMLKVGVDFTRICLLVFDECHHAMNMHPFNEILLHWKEQQAAGQANTQILGLTGSPGGCTSPTATAQKQERLCQNMGAQFLCVPFDSQEVMQVAPPAREVILEVDQRIEDSTFANQLAVVLLSHINVLVAGLPGSKLPAEVSQALRSGSCSSTLESWLTGLALPAVDATDFDIHLRLLLACNSCLDEVKVVGCEQALQSLGSSCCDAMHSTVSSPHDAASDSTQAPMMSHKPAAQLTSDFIAELAATSCQLPAVLKALQSGLHGAAVSFPRALKLVEFLAQMKMEKSSWHGIIFVKTRAGTHALTELLQQTADLAGVKISPLTGHGKTGNVAAVTDAVKGMNIRDQVDTLDSFRAAQGMNVLVATAAAEEGIDIPRCEFAVSYTVVESGREWTQRQGRARMHGSQFVSIIETGTTDLLQLNKSKREADNEYAAVVQSCFIV